MKKILAVFLTLIMCLGMCSTVMAAKKNFTDVKKSDWFYNDVQTAVELGLVNGKSETSYAPNDKLTYAEAIKLAACMNQLYTMGTVSIKAGNPWYQPYVDYCVENDIITKNYNYSQNATRAGYMEIFANALPDEGLEEINFVADDSIPDVPSSSKYAKGVYKLYRAGILQGVDAAHNCSPNNNITRSEVAAILTRMMDDSKRVSFTLGEKPEEEETKKEESKKEEAKEEEKKEEVKEETKKEETEKEEEKAAEPLKFTKQPIGGTFKVTGTIATNVTVEGGTAPYTYQWTYSKGGDWNPVSDVLGKVSGQDSARVSIKSEIPLSVKVRCEVTDSKGVKAISDAVDFIYLSLEEYQVHFAKNPEAAEVKAGEEAVFTVEATSGKGPYTYQWKYIENNVYKTFSSDVAEFSGDTTDTLKIKRNDAWDIEVFCEVKDANGDKATSERAKFTVIKEVVATEPLKITKQPENQEIKPGETAVYEVEVTGGVEPYKYQWLYENCEAWYDLADMNGIKGSKTNKLSITKNDSSVTNIRCMVTDATGKKVASSKATYSSAVKINPLAIETQPVDTTMKVGEDAVITVKAKDGVGTYTYQWQMNIGSAWVRLSENDMISGTTTDTLTLKSVAASYIDVRCKVSDATGASIASDGVRVTFE